MSQLQKRILNTVHFDQLGLNTMNSLTLSTEVSNLHTHFVRIGGNALVKTPQSPSTTRLRDDVALTTTGIVEPSLSAYSKLI